ncbi:DNA repair protein RadC [uncultured Rhodoblastus sp.]|uniref:RadC family protein n=1 Tax=uncultured Rhodoblastus sp. TaxID=543037 RepID=UPI0025E7D851|nr:DNA repair protein RadC [uncultured Rhodoblastus sp.]
MKDDAPKESLNAGHRERLRERFLAGGSEALADYEVLELLLFRAIPRRDVKPIAKMLLKKFGTFGEVIAAPAARLKEVEFIGDSAVTELKIVEAAARLLSKETMRKRLTLGAFTQVLDYCRGAMAFLDTEEFRVIFLDKKNGLLADEVQGRGTVDHTPVYPREIIRRALELNASAVILVHNHPSGDPTPSSADVVMTQNIASLAKPLGINVHDHLIIGRNGHASMRALKLF